MKTLIHEKCEITVDRDSERKEHGREGFYIGISDGAGTMYLQFHDEVDAVKMAHAILDRMGETHPPRSK